ncbi:MAG: hypothetical protein ABL889_11485 [Terricaulis sp.]|jgi:hypothetical protein
MADKKVGDKSAPQVKKPGKAAPPGQVGQAATPLNPNNPGKNKK